MSGGEIPRVSSGATQVPRMESQASHTSPNSDDDEEDNVLGEDDPRLFVVDSPKKKKRKKEDANVVRNYIVSSTSKTKKKEFWSMFKMYEEKGKIRAECIYCGKTFAADTIKNGTGNLSTHYNVQSIRPCLMNPAYKSKGTTTTQSTLVLDKIDDAGNGKMRHWVLDQVQSRNKLARIIICCELPFRFVEKYEFIDFLASVCPTFKVPSRSTITRDCLKMFNEEGGNLKAYFLRHCQRVCLTTDTWSSIQNVNYMVLTAHFIDNDWKLQKRILNFCPISSHKGVDIARSIEDCVRFWGLIDKVFSVTLDNAPSNDAACDSLTNLFVANKSSIHGGKLLHMRCAAHIGNIIVQEGLKIHDKCIGKVRKVVKFVKSSPARGKQFKDELETLGIESKCTVAFDVCTRWNSTYLMLKIALKYKQVFSRLSTPVDEDGELIGHISSDEWSKVEQIMKMLKVFYDFTTRLSGSSYVTIRNIFFFIAQIVTSVNTWAESSDPICHAMGSKMKVKCDKYWGDITKMNPILFIGVILNPRRKFDGLKVQLQDMYGLEKGGILALEMKDVLKTLCDEYRDLYLPPSHEGSVVSGSGVSTALSSESEALDFLISLDYRLDMLDECNQGLFTSEFDLYFHEPRVRAVEGDDILQWWERTAHRFPIMARIARDVLAVPVTSVPSESAFSTGGRTIDQFRSCLGTKTVEALICTQSWLRETKTSTEVVVDDMETLRESKQIEEDMATELMLGIADMARLIFWTV